MKIFKISLYALGSLLLLLVIGGGVFVATFDANQYKSLISEQVKQQTGREFTLEDIKPSVFPWLGIKLQQITLSNASGFKAEKMLQMQQLDVRVKLLPLLGQRIHIDTLQIHGLELFLEKNKQGMSNWEDILKKQADNAAAQTPKDGPKDAFKIAPEITPKTTPKITPKIKIENNTEKSTNDLLAGLLINGVDLKQAHISWQDESSGKNIALQNLTISTGALRVGEALPIKLSTEVDLSEPAARLKITMNTRLEFDLDAQTFKLDKMRLALDAKLQQADINQIQLSLNSSINMDLNKQQFDMQDYSVEIGLQRKLTTEELTTKKLTSHKKHSVFINGSATADLQKQTATLKPLKIQTTELTLDLQLAVKNLLDAPQAQGPFEIQEFNPRALAKAFAIALPDTRSDAVLQKASTSFYFAVDEKNLEMSSIKIRLDKSTFLAQLKLNNFAKPQILYSVKLDQLMLDDYLPPVVEPVKQSVTPAASKKVDIPIELPVELLRGLNVSGLFQAVSIVVSDHSVSNLEIETLANAGVIKVPKLNAQVLEGKVTSSALLDVRKNTPRYEFKLTGKRLKAEPVVNPILQDMLGEKSVSMTGETHLDLAFKTQGQSVNQLIAGTNGTFKMDMGKAELHGVDAEYFVRKGVVDFLEKKKQQVPQAWRGEYNPKETTALKVAQASAVIQNGVVENKDLLLEASRFKITGAGKIDLPQETLDYRVVVDVQPGKTNTAGERLLDVPMPVFVKGNFAQPAVSIDSKVWLRSVGKELKAEVKTEIKQKLKKQKDQKMDKAKNKLKDKFKGLFK